MWILSSVLDVSPSVSGVPQTDGTTLRYMDGGNLAPLRVPKVLYFWGIGGI